MSPVASFAVGSLLQHADSRPLLWGLWDAYDHKVNGQWLRVGSPEWEGHMEATLERARSYGVPPRFRLSGDISSVGRAVPAYEPVRTFALL